MVAAGGAASRTTGQDKQTVGIKPAASNNTTRPPTPTIDLTEGTTDPAEEGTAAAGHSKERKTSRKQKDTSNLPRITRSTRKDVNYAE